MKFSTSQSYSASLFSFN